MTMQPARKLVTGGMRLEVDRLMYMMYNLYDLIRDIFICKYVYIYVWMFIYMCLYMYTYIYIYICI